MVFSKAIQIKLWVNKFNEERSQVDYGSVKFEAEMFRDGRWSVTLRAVDSTLFFSHEIDRLITLYAGGGFTMRVYAIDGVPYIDMQ